MSVLFIILVSLTMTLFSEKVLISNRCISSLMSNLIKKSWTDSNQKVQQNIVWKFVTSAHPNHGMLKIWMIVLCKVSILGFAALKRRFFTMSKTDRHLLHQKVRQIISVMKTNTLYVSRKLAFWFTFCLKDNKYTSVCSHYWYSLTNFLT